MKIAIIGAGTAGREFAAACAGAGFQTVLEDVMPAKLRHAGEIFASLGHEVELVSNVEDAVRDADIAVDFVPDELESKLEIWSLIDRMAPPKTVMCTPSEALSITDLASCTYRADRCVMVRDLFAYGEVGVLSAGWTSEATRSIVGSLLKGLGRGFAFAADPDLPMLLKNMNAASIS